MTKDGQRQYQLLAVRINTADKPKLGIVLSVYRGALFRRKKNSSSSVCKIVGAALETEYASRLHVCLLSLDGPVENSSETSFHASCCSPVVVLDPMSEQGTVLGEIRESMVAFRETRVRHGWHICNNFLLSCKTRVVSTAPFTNTWRGSM